MFKDYIKKIKHKKYCFIEHYEKSCIEFNNSFRFLLTWSQNLNKIYLDNLEKERLERDHGIEKSRMILFSCSQFSSI